jgi:hypothetical protein
MNRWPSPDRAGFETNEVVFPCGEGVLEVPMILSAREAVALEWEASRQGMTAGEMIRRLVREFLEGQQEAAWQ